MSEGLTPEEADRRMKDHPELADEFLNFIHAVFDDLGKEEGEELPELSTVTDVDDIVSQEGPEPLGCAGMGAARRPEG